MKDPVRWRDDGSADAETRALLASSEGESPSKHQRERIWAGLVPHIQILPVPPPVIPVAPVAATGAGAVLGKIALGVVLVAAVGTGVHVARSRTPAAKPAPVRALRPSAELPKPVLPVLEPGTPAAPTPVVDKPVVRRPRPAVAVTAPMQAPEVHEVPVVQEAPAPVVVSNQLLEEGRRLSRARAALRAHDPEGALKLLQSGAAGSAGLAQEREALTIEALGARPWSRIEAERRARAFMAAYPDSPYRARLKALIFDGP
jgi:hypothetical protein